MASLLDILLGKGPEQALPSLDGITGMRWAYEGNPVGTSTTRPQQDARSAEGQPFDPVAVVAGGTPITRGQIADMVRQGWQTASSVSDGGLAAPGMMGAIKAYHGSPHSFDRFDMSRIGTGEGAQAYGHGLYFAGNEGVARSYRDALSGDLSYGGTKIGDLPDVRNIPGAPSAISQMRIDVLDNGMTPSAAIAKEIEGRRLLAEIGRRDAEKAASSQQPDGWGNISPDEIAQMLRDKAQYHETIANWLSSLNPQRLEKQAGHMYEVNLAVEPHQLLDWDKPATPDQQAALAPLRHNILREKGEHTAGLANSIRTSGNRFYKDLADIYPKTKVNELLQRHGVEGIQYLDAGSRAAGEGSRNYVMFDDALINILRKYALPGMIMGGAAAVNPFMQGGQDAQPLPGAT